MIHKVYFNLWVFVALKVKNDLKIFQRMMSYKKYFWVCKQYFQVFYDRTLNYRRPYFMAREIGTQSK